jgi:hypothetical protein
MDSQIASLHDSAELLSIAQRLSPGLLRRKVLVAVRETLEGVAATLLADTTSPPPSPISRRSDASAADLDTPPLPAAPSPLRAPGSVSTGRNQNLYQLFMSEMIPLIKNSPLNHDHRVNLTTAAQYWQRHKHHGTIDEILHAARADLATVRPRAPVAAAGGLRTATLQMPVGARHRLMSSESDMSMPDLEDGAE